MGIFSTIWEGFKTFGAIVGLIKQRDAELNSPEMIKRKEAQLEETEREADIKASVEALKTGKLDEVEKRAGGY